MAKRNKLWAIDEVRLEEVLLVIEHVRGTYTKEIEDDLDKLEDAVSEFLNKHRRGEER